MDSFSKNFLASVHTHGIRRLSVKKKRVNTIIYETLLERMNLKEYS